MLKLSLLALVCVFLAVIVVMVLAGVVLIFAKWHPEEQEPNTHPGCEVIPLTPEQRRGLAGK